MGSQGNDTPLGTGGATGNPRDSVAPDTCSLASTPSPHFLEVLFTGQECLLLLRPAPHHSFLPLLTPLQI